MQYRDEGYLKEAVINYLVALGWSMVIRKSFSLEEMIEKFDIDDINKSSSSLNMRKAAVAEPALYEADGPSQLAEAAGVSI